MKKQKLFILCAILCAGVLEGCTNSKFIIDKNGEIVARFEPTNMDGLKEKIKECL